MKLKLAGTALLAGAVASVVAAYAGKPDAQTCQVINNVAVQLGNAPSCSANPAAALMWLALGLGLAGLVLIAASRRRSA